MLTLTSPDRTWAHDQQAGVKMALLCLGTALLFQITSLPLLSLAAAGVLGMIRSCGTRFLAHSLRMLWPLWPFVLIVALWHLWQHDLTGGTAILLRMLTTVAAANFVTMTTRLSDMLEVIVWLARPVARLGLRPATFALSVALVIRFIPVMLLRMDQIRDALRARSARAPGWRLLVPALLAALDDADHVAEGLRARGGAG